jgi:hypothetical protein
LVRINQTNWEERAGFSTLQLAAPLRTAFCQKFVQSLLLVILDVHAEDSDRICAEQGVTDVSNTYQLLNVTTLRSVETSQFTR